MPDSNMIVAPMGGTFSEMERLAEAVARSGMFGMKTKEQALVLMAISQAEGRHPALAARDYDVIQGRPAKKSEAMLRDFLQGGGKVDWHALTDELADATFMHPAGGSVRIAWNMARVAKAGLAGKDNWKKFPRQMLRSRAISEGVRTVYPLATSGFYVPEEAAEMPPPAAPAGRTIDGKAETPGDARDALNDPHIPPAPDDRDALNASIPLREAPPAHNGPTLKQVVARLVVEFAQAQSASGLAAIEEREETQKVLARGPESDATKAVTKARDAARKRLKVIVEGAAGADWETPRAGVAEFEPANADTGSQP